jgi:hypothetical protein
LLTRTLKRALCVQSTHALNRALYVPPPPRALNRALYV